MSTLPLYQAPPIQRLQDAKLAGQNNFTTVSPLPSHAGLWLDRCYCDPQAPATTTSKTVAESKEDPNGKLFHFAQTIASLTLSSTGEAPAVTAYKPFFSRWQNLTGESNTAPEIERRVLELQVLTPLLLYQASSASVTDSSILLHHSYGVPYIPGSAVKGILRHHGARYIGVERGQEAIEALLGSDDTDHASAGFIEFSDALWIPRVNQASHGHHSPLMHETLTPHHNDYYVHKGSGNTRPDGMKNPIPVPFLAITPGTRFRLIVESWTGTGQCLKPWLDRIVCVLDEVLQHDGVGAKTSAGFGYLSLHTADDDGDHHTHNTSQTGFHINDTVTATVRLQKAKVTCLSASWTGGTAQSKPGDNTTALLLSLPMEIRKRLKKKRNNTIEAKIEIESVGANTFITAIHLAPQ